jgi:hypothetical protein
MQLTFFLQNHSAKNIMQFRQTEATIDLGLKTVTWIEHRLDNHGDTGQLTALRREFFSGCTVPDEQEFQKKRLPKGRRFQLDSKTKSYLF